MKKIDKLVFGAFISPFFLTFLVVVFILLNIQMLKYFDDIIGKGLGADVVSQLLFYFAIFTTPTALPLAVLLSSLIAFGNLGEHFELTAIKSSGISLIRTLRPIFFFVIFLTGVAFYANNNLVPKAALDAYSLLYDIKQKKPALDLREGSFYNGIPDISIKVNKKFPDGVTLKDIIVYDHRKQDGNKEVIVADSGKMQTILNEQYLKFELFNGYNYKEGSSEEQTLAGQSNGTAESLTRTKFSKTQVVFDLSSFKLSRTDKKWFEGNRMMKNLTKLDSDVDSIKREILQQQLSHYMHSQSFFNFYLKGDSLIVPEEVKAYKAYSDSVSRNKYVFGERTTSATSTSTPPATQVTPPTGKSVPSQLSTAPSDREKKPIKMKRPKQKESLSNSRMKRNHSPFSSSKVKAKKKVEQLKKDTTKALVAIKKISTDSLIRAKLDSIFEKSPEYERLQAATNMARQVKSQVQSSNDNIENYEKEVQVHKIQWHKILASSFACIAMFLIGAPLGSIIKKGGLGVPFLVSIIFFIIYYLLTLQGEKLAKQGAVSATAGVWAADVILFTIGFIFLKQAREDALLFEADFYLIKLDKLKQRLFSKKR